MKRITEISLFALSFLALASCTEETLPEQKLVPEDVSDIVVPGEGGEYVIGYSIENFAEDGTVTAETDAEWIASVYCGEYGKVSFIAGRNPDKTVREAVITVSYDKDPDGAFSVKVRQEAAVSGPRLVLMSDDTLSVSVPGGKYEIEYALLNQEGHEGLEASSQADWISAVTVEDKYVSVFVEPNISETGRETEVVIEYPELEPLKVVVVQSPLSSGVLDISIVSTTTREAQVAVEPSDQFMMYIVMVDTKERIDGMESDLEIYQDDLLFFQQYASSAGMSLSETMWVFLKQGSWTGVFDSLVPDTEYCCYGYGMNEKAEYQTVVYKKEFRTAAVAHSDCSFSISASAGTESALVTIEPTDDDVPYIAGIISPDAFFAAYGEFCNETMDLLLQDIIKALEKQGYDRQEIVSEVAYKGRQSLSFNDLVPGTRNMVYCVGLGENADMITDAFSIEFSTQEVELPPLTFTFDITEVKSRSVTASVTSSDNESYYCWGLVDASYTKDDIIRMFQEESKVYIELGAVKDFAGYVEMYLKTRGNKTRTFTNLVPQKDYKVYAMQLSKSWDFTYPISFSDICTTPEAVTADCTIEIRYDKFWDGEELAQLYPDFAQFRQYAVLPAEVVTQGEVASFKYAFLSGDWADPSLHSDDEAIQYLFEYGFTFKKNTFFVTWDYEFAIIAVAVDNDGNYSKVFRKSGILSKEDASDPSEYTF